MYRVDLHTHTTFSDGTLTPTQLVKLAAAKKLKAIAITDHDTIAGLTEGCAAAGAAGIDFVAGIEISSYYKATEIHILGLFLDKNAKALSDNLPDMAIARKKRNHEMLARLNDAHVHINFDNLMEFVEDHQEISITRSHFAKAIVDAGYCKTTEQAFAKYLLPGCATYVNREIFPSERAIELIRQSSGLAVLAHPLRYRLQIHEIDKMAAYLAEQGLAGLECLYSGHSINDQEQLYKIANKYRLSVSGGSDFHGSGKSGIELGTGYGKLFVPYSVYEDLKHLKQIMSGGNRPV